MAVTGGSGRERVAQLVGRLGLAAVLAGAVWCLSGALGAAEIRLSMRDATVFREVEGGLGQLVEVRDGDARPALYAHAPSRIGWSLTLPPGEHRLQVGLSLLGEALERSDGATFRAVLVDRGVETTLLERALVSPLGPNWADVDLPLVTRGGGVVLLFETGPGTAGGNDYDWCLWGEPRIIEGLAPARNPILVGMVGLALVLASVMLAPSGRRGARLWPLVLTALVGALIAGILVGAETLLRSRPDRLPAAAFEYLPEGGSALFPGRDHDLRYEADIGYRPLEDRCWRYRRGLELSGQAVAEFHPPEEASLEVCTDADGFANAPGLVPVIAVVGDSFVQATEVAEDDRWTRLLAGRAGRAVGNYGVGGYAPQQAAIVLRRWVLERRPEVVVFALFEGNDVHDAEYFEQYRRAGVGWRRLEAAHLAAGRRSIVRPRVRETVLGALASHLVESVARATPSTGVAPVEGLGFNPVTAELGGRVVRLSFNSLLLRRAAMSAEAWEAHPGFRPTMASIDEMRTRAREAGSRFVVALLPSKESLYPGLMSGAIAGAAFERFVAAEPHEGTTPSWGDYLGNRGSLNVVLRARLNERGVDVVDLRPAFEAAAARGEELYFPLDSHWNEAGNRLAAEEVWRQLEVLLETAPQSAAASE